MSTNKSSTPNTMPRAKRSPLTVLIILSFIAVFGYFFYSEVLPTLSNSEYVDYKTFYNYVGEGLVTEVEISDKKIVFSISPSVPSNEKTEATAKYRTDNPHSPTLNEYLLIHGVSVTEEANISETISLVFDILFYVFFAAIVIFAFRKFISPNTFRVSHRTGITFDKVVGMDGLKRDMLKVIEIMKHPAEYRAKGIRTPKGILLEGDPGNGKTLFARALAGEAKINFIPAKATDFESMFMAIGPMKVKLLFRKARKCAPCIVFIDEFDGIGTKRNYSGSAIETENTRIVTALLNELDGFTQNNGILVLAATNSITALDSALIRPGRFDAKYTVPYPDSTARAKLISLYSNGKKAAADCTTEILAKKFDGYSCAQIESVINRAAILAGSDNREEFTMDDIKTAIRET